MINFFIRQRIFLFILLLLSLILRFWNLSNFPPHLRNDEAALGYNAYSILETGRDEHGEFLPVVFQSFGDWKMGGYIYLTVPFIAIFGLTELAVRFPSALAGVISVWLIYEIVVRMFSDKRLALISSFVFGTAPIFLTFSRGAWEVNLALTLTLAGIYFFQKALETRKFLLLSTFFFGLSLLTAHSAKLSSPIIGMVLLVSYFGKFKKIPIKIIIVSILIAFIFVIPVWLSFSQGKFTRITTLSIFSYYSDYITLFKSIANRWFGLYSLGTLFLRGDGNPQHTAPNMGPFLLLDLIFLIIGSIWLIKKGSRDQNIFTWLLLSLLSLPSALTIEKINFERILPMFIPLVILISIGIKSVFEKLKKHQVVLILLVFLYSLNYFYFLDLYFIHGPKKNDAWQYGYKQVVEKVIPIQNSYKKVFVQQSLEQPYIFFLFYQRYSPLKYQQIAGSVFLPNKEDKDMGSVSSLDNIIFADIDWKKDHPVRGTLFVMPKYKLDEQSKFYPDYQRLYEVKDLNGFPRFEVVKI